MMDAPIFFVFENGCPDVVGLSVLQDGSNLPKTCDSKHEWKPTKRAVMNYGSLRGLTVDIELALSNLRTRGYHIGPTSAVVINFPDRSARSLL